MDKTVDTLTGEGEIRTTVEVRVRRKCDVCGEPAHYKQTRLLEGTRSNPASAAYGRDDCSWCEDARRYVCKEHLDCSPPPDGYVRGSTFPASERFAHMFLKWEEKEGE